MVLSLSQPSSKGIDFGKMITSFASPAESVAAIRVVEPPRVADQSLMVFARDTFALSANDKRP